MILSRVTIHKYKSFLTEQTFEVEPKTTRIVGKNESGKTALLEALAKTRYFETNPEFRFVQDLDYPRSGFAGVRGTNPKVVTCYYELSMDEMLAVDTIFTPGVVSIDHLAITTFYDNTVQVEGISVNMAAFKDWLMSLAEANTDTQAAIAAATSFEEIQAAVSSIATLKAKITEIAKSKVIGLGHLEAYVYKTYLESKLPKFWYFSDYYSLPYRINLTDFANGRATTSLSTEELMIAKALFELSGLSIADIQNEANYEAYRAQLEATSSSITD